MARRMKGASVILLAAAALLLAVAIRSAGAPLQQKLKSSSPRPRISTQLPTDLPHLYQRTDKVFPTHSATHVEPILNYRVKHEDNIHLHTLENTLPTSTHPLKLGNAAKSIGAHSLKMRHRNGLKQPFPNTISISFRAFDQDFSFPHLHLDVKLFGENAQMEIWEGENQVRYEPHSLNTYVTVEDDNDDDSSAVITLAEDGLMTATIFKDGQTYQINPLFVHAHETHPDVFTDLKESSPHAMVMVRHADMTHLQSGGHQCGAIIPKGEVRQKGNFSAVEQITMKDVLASQLGHRDEETTTTPEDATSSSSDDDDASSPPIASSRRRLLTYPPGYGITLWTNCYTGDQTSHKISVGVAVDYGYYNIYGSTANVQNSVANIYASVNAVYMAQFDTFLEIASTLFKTASDTIAWNIAPPSAGAHCTNDISTQLNDFTSWRTSVKPTTNGLWHLLTNCDPAPGTVGLAWVGVMCSSQYGTGVSSWNTALWLTVAHETGHNFGAQHTFQNGQGTTGGIMDYGDGTYPIGSGIYQFLSQYNEPQMCPEIASIISTTGFSPYCWANYAPVCGNGVIENGEQCDDSTSCCSSCRLTGQCTPGNGGVNSCCSASCQYIPSTTRCDNNLGFCSNGACSDAICPQYGLPFCGMSANGCQIQCGGAPSTYSCSSNWQTPNCNLASGTVCATSTYSTCSGTGTCTATTPPVTYSWVTTAFGTCSCLGSNTRTVTCQSSTGTPVADSYCSSAGAKPSTTGTCTAPSTCYQWKQSTWSACSVNCGTGTQTCSVTCVQGPTSPSPGATVSNAQCTGAAPATQQTCTLAACPTSWTSTAWSSCSRSCGSGTQTRTNQCVQTQNGLQSNVASQYCTAPAPATSQSCNTPQCTDGQYSYSAWSTCTKACGGGVQNRTYTCVNSQSVAYPDNSHCSYLGAPITGQVCNTGTCPSYAWYAFAWGTCTTTCGSGTQTRQVGCYDVANDPGHTIQQNTNYCTLTMPVTIQTCNTPACPVPPNYQWTTSAWSTCSVTCGGGTSTRTATCVNTVDSSVQPASSCSASPQPATQQACSVQGCPTYAWAQSGWSSCTVSCGGGVQTQNVVCKQDGTTTVADSTCISAGAGAKPQTSQTCNTASCPPAPIPHAWVQGSPSPCSVQCNSGTWTYTPQCYRTDTNVPIGNGNCSDILPKPPTTGSCNTQACPTYWFTGSWSSCSASCGPSGLQTRSVGCFYSTDDPATATPQVDSACTSSKPATQASCNPQPCPTWQYSSDWSDCSVRCSTGIQTRNITCQNYDGTPAPDSACATAVAPVVQQTCQIIPCPHWHRNLWGDCSKPCADSFGPGVQNRTVICRMPHDDPLYYGIPASDPTLCPGAGGDSGDGDGQPGVANGKPPTTQQCNTDACPAYYWAPTSVSVCSASCGSGTQTTTYTCTDSNTGLAAKSSNLCLTAAPPSQSACNTFTCPEYIWVNGTWSDCSAFCGEGIQTRTVQCRNLNPDPSIHYAYVDVDLSYCTSATSPVPPSSQVCVQPNNTCWGSAYTTGGLINGRCDATTNTCVCRSGYSDATCSTHVGISNVVTNGAVFGAAGIPINEPLTISWSSDVTQLTTVDIILVRTSSPDWPVGQYLASNIVNTNSWVWTVGSILKSGLEPGSDYVIRVWYSKNAYGDSAAVTVADPCAYMSCGLYGTCSRGQCVCGFGYTGALCSVGPCERSLCDPTTSTCRNADVIASGRYSATTPFSCPCVSGYTGSQCKTPNLCATTTSCLNGGDLTRVLMDANGTSCTGTCGCRNLWFDATCATCNLNCQHGGAPNSDCSSCQNCASGYFGKQCECQYYLVTVRLDVDVSSWYPTNTLALSRWSATLALDLQKAIASVSPYPAAVSLDGIAPVTSSATAQVDVTMRLSLECASTGHMSIGGGGGDDDADFGSASSSESLSGPHRRLLQSIAVNATVSLSATWTTLLPLFSDTDSPLWRGQLTSLMDTNSTATASDPSGQSKLAQPTAPADCFQTNCAAAASVTPSGGDSSTGAPGSTDSGSDSFVDKIKGNTLYLALFAIGALIVLILLGVMVFCCCRHYRKEKSATTHLSRLGSSGLESEMTQNPALASIQHTGRWNQI